MIKVIQILFDKFCWYRRERGHMYKLLKCRGGPQVKLDIVLRVLEGSLYLQREPPIIS